MRMYYVMIYLDAAAESFHEAGKYFSEHNDLVEDVSFESAVAMA